MKSITKLAIIGLTASLSVGCAYKPDVKYPKNAYDVEVNVFKTKDDTSKLLKQTANAIKNHDGDVINDLIRLPLNQKEALYYYGVEEHTMLQICDCVKLNWDFQSDNEFYNVTHLDTVVSQGEWINYDASKMAPYNEFYVPDSQDFVVDDRSFGIKIDNHRNNQLMLNFHYKDEKMVSLDDVSTEEVFVPVNDQQYNVEHNQLVIPERDDGVTLINIMEKGDHSKIFVMTVSPK